MKSLILLLLCLASIAQAQTVQSDFAYKFRNPEAIGFCPGVSLRLLSVSKIKAAFSGGKHGHEALLTQELINSGGVGIYIPHYDLRALVEVGMQTRFDARKSFSYGPSLGQAFDPAIAMMEQIPVRNAEISICISRFDLSALDQNPGVGTDTSFDIGYQIFLTSDTSQGRQTRLVQELRGQATTRTDYSTLITNWDPHGGPLLLANAWPSLNEKFNQFLAPVMNEVADRNLQTVKAELAQVLGGGL